GLARGADLERHRRDAYQIRSELPERPLEHLGRPPPVLHEIEDADLVSAVEVPGETAETEVGKLHDVIEAGGRVGHRDEQDLHRVDPGFERAESRAYSDAKRGLSGYSRVSSSSSWRARSSWPSRRAARASRVFA